MRRRTKFALLVTSSLALIFLFESPTKAYARVIPSSGTNEPDATILTDPGQEEMSHTAVLPEEGVYDVKYFWSIGNTVKVNAGDTMNFYIPKNVNVTRTRSFNMASYDGKASVGKTTVTIGSHVGVCTFNNFFATHKYRKEGYISFEVRGAGEPEEVTPPVTNPEEPGTEEPNPGEPGPEVPGVEEPGPEIPGTETPGPEEPGGPEAPGVEEPGPEVPGTETPGPEEPGGPEAPGIEGPGIEEPNPEKPGGENPAGEIPGTTTPGVTYPPVTPGPVVPEPETPVITPNDPGYPSVTVPGKPTKPTFNKPGKPVHKPTTSTQSGGQTAAITPSGQGSGTASHPTTSAAINNHATGQSPTTTTPAASHAAATYPSTTLPQTGDHQSAGIIVAGLALLLTSLTGGFLSLRDRKH
ncbi:Ig-like domain-containing protein [Levilactobacillus lanxiensis]|uniref:Ig-like domain-containing protein n=1 Tax=Levilactobacillus lanxiensis TaxID=2799568 RepID=A0ABW4D353_9LACO|nr:Ig-like domain-containing protein [Levilactobacillus lanxiensis]